MALGGEVERERCLEGVAVGGGGVSEEGEGNSSRARIKLGDGGAECVSAGESDRNARNYELLRLLLFGATSVVRSVFERCLPLLSLREKHEQAANDICWLQRANLKQCWLDIASCDFRCNRAGGLGQQAYPSPVWMNWPINRYSAKVSISNVALCNKHDLPPSACGSEGSMEQFMMPRWTTPLSSGCKCERGSDRSAHFSAIAGAFWF